MVRGSDIYEWDWLHTEKTLDSSYIATFYDTSGNALSKLENITTHIRRGKNYEIIVSISFSSQGSLRDISENMANLGDLKIVSDYSEYIFSDYFDLNSLVKFGAGNPSISLEVKYKKLQVNFRKSGEAAFHNEWYLNGLSSDISMPDVLEFSQEITYSWNINGTNEKKITYTPKSSVSRNTAIIKGDGVPTFLLSCVPDKFGKFVSKNTTIEYRSEFGDIPDKKTRKSIEEITGFVIGNHLINIGYTSYDETGKLVEVCVLQPESYLNLETLRNSPARYRPVNLNVYNHGRNIGVILPQILKIYLERKDELMLDIVFYSYWLSQTLPLEHTLPVLQNGFEVLVKRILREDETKPLKFRHPDKEKMGKKSGFFDALRFICDTKLNLEIGDLEKNAVALRNEMTHSRILWETMSDEMREGALSKLLTYYTLFNRIILRSLGYEGEYIDWATTELSKHLVSRPIIKGAE